jgi:glutathione S-transferase
MPYQLYITNKNYSSWSMRTWVLMKALEIPFEEKLIVLEQSERQPQFFKFSPTGLVPCILDGDTTVWDSVAINEYLADAHPGVWPADKRARAFARCAVAEIHSSFQAMKDQMSFNCSIRVDLGPNGPTPALRVVLDRIDALWKEGLSSFGGPWLAGPEFTAVDAFYSPVVARLQTYGVNLSEDSMAYAKRVREHPVVADWLEQSKNEPWREEFHEGYCLNFEGRTLIDDLRKGS